MCWVARKWCEAEDEADEARINGSKCSLSRSNSKLSGAESSYFWSWSEGVWVLLDMYGTTWTRAKEGRRGHALARLVGFSKVIPTSAESQRQWLQYKKNGGSPRVFMVDIRPSADSGGSDGTTIKVFLQDGHRKQFRAHLRKTKSEESGGSHRLRHTCSSLP